MRFAIKTRPEHQTWEELRDVWVAADEIPLFESAWNWDHFYPLSGDMAGPCFEAWTMLAAMAQATRRIRLGSQVTGMIYRHPAVLANMAAALDIISDGRLELGVGAGWNDEEAQAYGIPLPPLKERFDRFDEGLDVIVGLLTQETLTYDGRYLQLTEARCEPKAVQRPMPPITIGGSGPTRTLRAVARHAQAWNAITGSPAEWQGKHEVLVERCAEIGRDPAEILSSVNARVTKNGTTKDWAAKVADLAHDYAEVGVGLLVVNVPNPHDPADLEPLADALRPLAG